MQLNQYTQMTKDMNLVDNRCKVEDLSSVFLFVNFESDKTSVDADVNDDKALMRHEFLEAFVRIAHKKFGHQIPDTSEAVEKLLDKHVIPNMPAEAVDENIFRRQRLYVEATDKILASHQDGLKVIYEIYSNLHPVGGKPNFGVSEWYQLLEDVGILKGPLAEVTTREVRFAFFHSKVLINDEVQFRRRLLSLNFLEFLEAVSRLSDIMHVPTKDDLEALGAHNIIEFDLNLPNAPVELRQRLRTRRPSTGLLSGAGVEASASKTGSNGPSVGDEGRSVGLSSDGAASGPPGLQGLPGLTDLALSTDLSGGSAHRTRDLAEKVDLTVRRIIGRLGMLHKGVLKASEFGDKEKTGKAGMFDRHRAIKVVEVGPNGVEYLTRAQE